MSKHLIVKIQRKKTKKKVKSNNNCRCFYSQPFDEVLCDEINGTEQGTDVLLARSQSISGILTFNSFG